MIEFQERPFSRFDLDKSSSVSLTMLVKVMGAPLVSGLQALKPAKHTDGSGWSGWSY